MKSGSKTTEVCPLMHKVQRESLTIKAPLLQALILRPRILQSLGFAIFHMWLPKLHQVRKRRKSTAVYSGRFPLTSRWQNVCM